VTQPTTELPTTSGALENLTTIESPGRISKSGDVPVVSGGATAAPCDLFGVCAFASFSSTDHKSNKQHRTRIVSPFFKRTRTRLRTISLSVEYFGGQSIIFNKLSAVSHPFTPSPVPITQVFKLELWLAFTRGLRCVEQLSNN
jgi:hypothetical protein